MMMWLLGALLLLSPTLEQREAKKRAARGGKKIEAICPILKAAPFMPFTAFEKIAGQFLRKSGRFCSSYLPTLLGRYPSPKWARICGLTPIQVLHVGLQRGDFTLRTRNTGLLDLNNIIKEKDLPIILRLGIRAKRKKTVTFHVAYEGTLMVKGTKISLKAHELARITWEAARGTQHIEISLLTEPQGPLTLLMESTKGITLLSTTPKSPATFKKVLRDPQFFKNRAPSRCDTYFDPADPHAAANTLALKGVTPRYALNALKKTRGYSPFLDAMIMGRFALARGWHNKAFAHFKRASTLRPEAMEPQIAMGEIEVHLGLPLTALTRLTALRKRFGSTTAALEVASMAYSKREVSNFNTLVSLAAQNPHHPAPANVVALESIRRGESMRGIRMLLNGFHKGSLMSLSLLSTYFTKLPQARSAVAGLPRALQDLLYESSVTRPGTCTLAPCRSFHALMARHTIPLSSIRHKNIKDNRVLLDTKLLSQEQSGASRFYRSVYIKVGDPKTLGRGRSFSTTYSPSREMLHLDTATVYHPDGTVSRESAISSFRQVSDVKARMYYDLMEITLSFPPLIPGDVVHIAYRVESLPFGNKGLPFHGKIIQFQEFIPVNRSEVHIYHPKRYPFRSQISRTKGIFIKRDTHKQLKHTSYISGQLPGVAVEKAMPGWGETLLAVQTGPGVSWEEIGRRYGAFIRPQYTHSRALSRIARAITASARTRPEKIAAVHRWVLKNFRYVALMFGLHSYLPYTPEAILSRRFGDCKDMTLLIILLLKEVGIEAWPAAVRTRMLGEIPTLVPSLAPFDHSIVYLPRERRWLDTTTKEVIYPLLPPHIEGRPALVISPKGGVLMRTTRSTSTQNRELAQTTITLKKSGNTSVVEKIMVQGAAEIGWRALLEKRMVPSKWDHHYAGSGKPSVVARNLASKRSPLLLKSRFTLRTLFVKKRSSLSGDLSFYEGIILKRLAPFTTRRQDLLFDFPGEYSRKVVVHLPKGYCVMKGPTRGDLEEPWLSFHQRVETTKRQFILKRRFTIKGWRVTAKNYPAFKKAVAKISRHVSTRLVVQRCKK